MPSRDDVYYTDYSHGPDASGFVLGAIISRFCGGNWPCGVCNPSGDYILGAMYARLLVVRVARLCIEKA